MLKVVRGSPESVPRSDIAAGEVFYFEGSDIPRLAVAVNENELAVDKQNRGVTQSIRLDTFALCHAKQGSQKPCIISDATVTLT
jgi:hypothetical protein